jgi:uncharacterized protein YabE (DUF348 family)
MVYGDHESERRQSASFESSPVKQEVIAMSKLAERSKTVTYYVNGEALTTTEHKLTVREILLAAGFEPAEDYRLTRDNGHHQYDSLDDEVPVHESERFTATFNGPTPTS